MSLRNANDLSFISPKLRSQTVVEKAFGGSSADQLDLGTNFLEGTNGFRKSTERAVYWLTQAVNGGEVFALNQLGLCYLEGIGAIKDEKVAFDLIKLGAEKGDVTAMVNAALLSASGRGTAVDYHLAADFLKEATSKGYGPAAYQLGQMQMNGWGVPQDGNAAFQSFTLAASEGVMEGHTGLAQCYTDGVGTSEDLQRAKHHWMTASHGGETVALRCVGERLLNGSHGFAVDHEEARRYLERAAKAGDAQAQYKLALCYAHSIGGPQNLKARDEWLEKAIAQKHHGSIAEKQIILKDEKYEVSVNNGSESSNGINSPNTKGKWRTRAQRIFHPTRKPTVISGSGAR